MIQTLYKEEIAKHMAKTGLAPKDPDWIGHFQGAINAVIKSLGGDAKAVELYAETAKTWNQVEPPEEIKRK